MAGARYTTTPEYTSRILVRGSEEYEYARKNNPSADTPSRYPLEIHVVQTAEEIAAALKRATDLTCNVGIRSSGHIMHMPCLIQDGILIDTVNLNRMIDYNPLTHEISFGPSVRVEELASKLVGLNRFFPHGHAPTVGAGGFLLAGGQGWFVRGWGATNQTWINKIEMVMPDGRFVTASPTENRDLWWAARGSGMGFFGVITKFYCRTMKASKMWERIFKFEINSDNYETLMTWAIERGHDTPKWWTDLNLTIDYPEKYNPACITDAVPTNSKLVMTLNLLCYSDVIREARTLLGAYDKMPEEVKEWLIEMHPVQRRTFDEVFSRKRGFLGNAGKDRWQINSIMSDPEVPLPKVSLDSVSVF
jgi:FAD/FMN-containing dehydrogenase